LGHPLFDRAGARLHLNASGRELLASLRVAMRALDEGVEAVVEGAHRARGEILVASPPEAAPLVAAWVIALAELAPELALTMVARPVDVAVALRRGDLDLALVPAAPAADGLSALAVGPIRWRLYRRPHSRAPAPPWRLITTPDTPWPSDDPHVVAASVGDLATAALAVSRSPDLCA